MFCSIFYYVILNKYLFIQQQMPALKIFSRKTWCTIKTKVRKNQVRSDRVKSERVRIDRARSDRVRNYRVSSDLV